MLKAMAQFIRPATERRASRHVKSPSPRPAGGDELVAAQQQHQPAIPTRRSSRPAPPPPQSDTPIATNSSRPPATAAPPTRTRSRKRPASEIATDARPPTKVTVTQPHGELVRITNGVPKQLGIGADDVPSGSSTPNPSGMGASLGVPAQTPAPSTDKRSLRSHDGGSRLKSDLATYFGNYDDIMAGVPKPPEFLDIDTPIYLVDEPLKSSKTLDPPSPEASRKSASPSRSCKSRAQSPTRKSSIASIPPSKSSAPFIALDYTNIARVLSNDGNEDPLNDNIYFGQHRRAERKEKQLRNIEKDRAMHEKAQLERLLDGLQGPDWLKVMGITGVTDGERKNWEPKRDYFIKEVQALVDKFRIWKEQEKKLRAEKEAAHAARDEEDDEESESDPEPRKHTTRHRPSDPHPREPETPKPRRPPRPHGFLLPYIPPAPTSPFTSFYSKPHLRQAALGKQRHGRNATAFGHPVPELEQHPFALPDDFVTQEFLRDNARKRRRRKRESGVGPQ
ncbi:hypothetical protein K458DRAFT_390666 [Lentithecium fluviatile CBS 122367]|uniref:Something about silencing protein 4 domain-containing protein n=1 Tax=Lentithecium fluviatile CBS 122367 TaxID=1168545 RepID=A0A6G1IXY0_9PLEO|nr:hypothetical protein K458DRAFT_390666 [Lentithecium fluviatile CBS 122367]